MSSGQTLTHWGIRTFYVPSSLTGRRSPLEGLKSPCSSRDCGKERSSCVEFLCPCEGCRVQTLPARTAARSPLSCLNPCVACILRGVSLVAADVPVGRIRRGGRDAGRYASTEAALVASEMPMNKTDTGACPSSGTGGRNLTRAGQAVEGARRERVCGGVGYTPQRVKRTLG